MLTITKTVIFQTSHHYYHPCVDLHAQKCLFLDVALFLLGVPNSTMKVTKFSQWGRSESHTYCQKQTNCRERPSAKKCASRRKIIVKINIDCNCMVNSFEFIVLIPFNFLFLVLLVGFYMEVCCAFQWTTLLKHLFGLQWKIMLQSKGR